LRPTRLASRLLPVVVVVFAAACTGDGGSSTSAAASPGSTVAPSASAGSGEAGPITIYSGRSEELVGMLIEQFIADTGIDAEVRYGDTAEMANLILTEGENSPADVFFAQDAGALGAVAQAGMLAPLPDGILDQVDARFRSPDGEWVGVSGRARVVVYNTDAVSEADLPDSIFGFTDPAWSGRIGWVPTNASFQSFVTALRAVEGEDRAREWLEGIQANDPSSYDGNNAALDAVIAGEIDVAFVNHYYLMQRLDDEPDLPAANHFLGDGDPGALVNVAGAGVLAVSDAPDAAVEFVSYLVSADAQRYFADETKEYPLAAGVEPDPALTPLAEIGTPELDLSDLADLEGTLELLQELGIL
jgi:iron(III) transport system substrate-binding protein